MKRITLKPIFISEGDKKKIFYFRHDDPEPTTHTLDELENLRNSHYPVYLSVVINDYIRDIALLPKNFNFEGCIIYSNYLDFLNDRQKRIVIPTIKNLTDLDRTILDDIRNGIHVTSKGDKNRINALTRLRRNHMIKNEGTRAHSKWRIVLNEKDYYDS